jgi:two-component system CheB/CheR fusion protein
MCLLEFLGERAAGRKIQIFGTDLDELALAHARLGIYPATIEVDVSPERLQRFFSRVEKGYQISRQIRDMIVFARHNLSQDPPFSRLDLVSCRNVLIYMQPPLQRKVLRIFHYALNPDAFLLLGTSESVGDAADLFALVDRKLKIYAKKNIPATAVFELGSDAWPVPSAEAKPGVVLPEVKPTITIQQLADRKVLEKYGPPGVLVSEGMDILQFRGRTGPYFEPAPGVATLNLFKLARPDLLMDLRATIHKAWTENVPITSRIVRLQDDNGHRLVSLDVMPLQDAGSKINCLLVLFREVLPPLSEPSAEPKGKEPPADPRVAELERELSLTKEYLHTTIEELEAANEELKSSNEELQSSNEELQSTNEELETSKEELQSTNEELNTVNEELHHRMSQLNVTNDDMQNVMAAIAAPVVIVGMDLRIRRFSAAAERLLTLIPADIGRPVAYLKAMLRGANVEPVVAEVVNAIRPAAVPVRAADGTMYSMRVAPYRTADHAIRGAVIELDRTLADAPDEPSLEARREEEPV